MSELLLRCGCTVRFDPKGDYITAPICGEHGVTAIVRTVGMPAPRIRGIASGPHVQTTDVPVHTGRLVDGPPLMKEVPARG